jgi:hypothetical protein
MARKAEATFTATVFHQSPAADGVAQLSVVGKVYGTCQQCWDDAKKLTRFPVLEFSNEKTH